MFDILISFACVILSCLVAVVAVVAFLSGSSNKIVNSLFIVSIIIAALYVIFAFIRIVIICLE